MTNVKERIGPVLSEIAKVIYADNTQLQLDELGDPYIGYIDGFPNNYYFGIFDLEDAGGIQLRETFFNSTKDEKVYHFNPTHSFRVDGTLCKRGVQNNLEWVVLVL